MGERTDQELLSWVIEHAGRNRHGIRSRWAIVGAVFGLGSTSAIALCRRFGHDPDERMGQACEQWECCDD